MLIPRIYLAGPDVFYPEAISIGRQKRLLCDRYGFEGLYPLDNELDGSDNPSTAIYLGNIAMLRKADLMIANITPFRGSGMDPGTAFEVGFCKALGKPVYLYSNDPHTHKERINPDSPVDEDGCTIEDFRLAENLMIAHAGEGPLFNRAVEAADRLRSLENFEAALAFVARKHF